MFLATMALALLLPTTLPVQASLSRLRLATFILTITAIVFRSEVAVLLFCTVGYIILKQIARHGHLTHGVTLLRSTVLPAGIFGTLVALAMTISTDTFFWQSPTYLWPEFSAFLSNIFPSDNSLGASAWGTQPWHWYFTNALPRILLNPFIYLPLYLLAISNPSTSEPTLDLLLPNLAYIAIYSILPHKETRFIFPVIPPLTLIGALSSSYIWTRRHRTWLYRIVSIGVLFSTIVSALLAHAFVLPLSALSYPGAHALNALHNYNSNLHTAEMITHKVNNTTSVHLDNLSTQTGITRFLQHSPAKTRETNWIYDKSENTTNLLDPFWWTQFDYAIMESPQLAIGSWEVVSIVRGLGQIQILHPLERREKEGLLTGGERLDFWEDGIDRVALQMCGLSGGQVSVTVRQILREGYGAQWLMGTGWSWTRGWWVDVGWVPKLYVLKRQESLVREDMQEASSVRAEDP
jgi:alpha-1,6-mannosyltransferase